MQQYIKTISIILVVIVGIFALLYFFGASLMGTFSPSLEVTSGSNINTSGTVTLLQKAPYFNLLSLEGTRVNLEDFAGSGTVITFWSTWNSESVDQIKIFDDYLATQAKSKTSLPLHIIAINSQEATGVAANFIRRGGYEIPVALDQTGETSNVYGIQTLPTTFFLDKEGRVMEIVVGTISERMLVDKIEKIVQ
jgi:peroxiredoxin